MRSFAAVVLATSLVASNAFAADFSAPLAAGKPAGVKQAQMGDHNTLMLLLGVGILGAGIGFAVSGNSNVITPATTTTTTTTTTSTATTSTTG